MSNKRFTKEPRHSYRSPVIDRLRDAGGELRCGRLVLRLAQDFGFCWGVDRAVALVWDALRDQERPEGQESTPAPVTGRNVWLLNQIIHNPRVNEDFVQRGVRFLMGKYADGGGFDDVRAEDLVVIPAFSAEVEHLNRLTEIGCEILDTTCPWVEKPHRRVVRYVEDGCSVLIHGILRHDETRSTCSLVNSKGGQWLVVRDLDQTDRLCAAVRGELSSEEFRAEFGAQASEGFDPTVHLQRMGIVNQTTMLATESKEVAARMKKAFESRDGAEWKESFHDFDTICPATQENQDAVLELSDQSQPDLFVILGGYDSSNTRNLLRAATPRLAAYHVQVPASVGVDAIEHRDPSSGEEKRTEDWMPAGEVVVALTAGASTPDTELAEVIQRVCDAAGERFPAEQFSSAP